MTKTKLEEIQEYKTLLTYSREGLIIEGQDLVELANMYHLSAEDFFEILPAYLRLKEFMGCRIISTKIITPEYEPTSRELLVGADSYNQIKESIFRLALMGCSKIADRNMDHWAASCLYLKGALEKSQALMDKQLYHAIYSSSHGGFNIKASNVLVDEAEVIEKYSRLK